MSEGNYGSGLHISLHVHNRSIYLCMFIIGLYRAERSPVSSRRSKAQNDGFDNYLDIESAHLPFVCPLSAPMMKSNGWPYIHQLRTDVVQAPTDDFAAAYQTDANAAHGRSKRAQHPHRRFIFLIIWR